MATELNFNLPVAVNFGSDALENIPKICKTFEEKILIVTSRELHHIEKQVLNVLTEHNIDYNIYYLEEPEPDCKKIDSDSKNLSNRKFDCLIGIGGGSVLDMTKSLSITLTNKEPIWEFANLSYRPPKIISKKTIPIIAIPTTSGTGSEVTPYAVLSNKEIKQKGTIQQPEIFPKMAIIIPEFMTSMPKKLTATTGIDAFAHALESLINISKQSPISELVSYEAMKIIFENLPKVIDQPNEIKFRRNMAWASTLAGIAIAHRGTTTTHAIAETLGGLIKIPHGEAVSISTIPVLTKTIPQQRVKFKEMFMNVFPESVNDERDYSDEMLNRIISLITTVGMNKSLIDSKEDIPEGFSKKIVNKMLDYKYRPLKQHPVIFDTESLNNIVSEIVYGQRN